MLLSSLFAAAAITTFPLSNHWMGADANVSVKTKWNKTAWFFGDTYGGVARLRQRKTLNVRNSVGISRRDGVVHQVNMNGEDFFTTDQAGQWYWPRSAVMVQGTLMVFLGRYAKARATEAVPFPFKHVGDDVAMVSNPKEHPRRWVIEYVPLNRVADVNMAGSVVKYGKWLYIFSTVDDLRLKTAPIILHRVLKSNGGGLQYLRSDGVWRDGIGYQYAKIIHYPGVTEFSVTRERGGFRVVVQDRIGIDDRSVYTGWHKSLEQGWTDLDLLHTIDAPADQICYGAKAIAGRDEFVYTCQWNGSRNWIDLEAYQPVVVPTDWRVQ